MSGVEPPLAEADAHRGWFPPGVRAWAGPAAGSLLVVLLTVAVHAPLVGSEPGFVVVIATVCGAFAAIGLILLRTQARPGAGLGFLGAGVLFAFAGVDAWPRYGPALAFVCAGPFLVPLGWGVFRYADPALSRPQRLWVTAASIIIFGGTLAQLFLSRPEWNKYPPSAWWPTLYGDRDLYDALNAVLGVGWLALGFSFSWLLITRVRNANFFERDELRAVAVGGVLLSIFSAAVFILFLTLPSWFSWRHTYGILGLLMGFLLIAFLASLGARLRLQTKLLDEVPRLPTPVAVTHYLRSALEDSALELIFYDRTTRSYLTTGGQIAPPLNPQQQSSTVLDSREEPLAQIVAGSRATAVWGGLSGFKTAVIGAIENARLQAVLEARALELTESRRELIGQRDVVVQLHRNLHDTVQQTLYAARLDAMNSARERSQPLDSVVEKVERAIGQVRTIAQGSVPLLRSTSIEAEIMATADELGLRASIVIQSIPIQGIEPDLLAVCREALTNVHKHASASETLVRTCTTDTELRLEVMDDGRGAAPREVRRGSGILGMEQRLRARGGHLELHTNPGSGTKVIATWPLA